MLNIPPGQMLGPYKIISQLGQGGMATVYKAYHASMDRYVALKVLSHQFAFSKEFYARFQHEARLIARLEHPHILPVYDFGESNGIPYLVMRYLEAGTLKDRLEADPLSLSEVDRIFTQLVEALAYAHENGIVHRDIKPSNAMLDKRGEVFLTDFGIAKLVEGSPQFTATGAITGTPAYMSPEQAQGFKIDPRSDLYSMGIVLYEMISGHVPYEAETPLAVILKQIQEPLPPISTIRPDIHPAIEAFVLKTLAKTPEERYANCTEMLAAWKRAYQEAVLSKGTQSHPQAPLEKKPTPPRTEIAPPVQLPPVPPPPLPAVVQQVPSRSTGAMPPAPPPVVMQTGGSMPVELIPEQQKPVRSKKMMMGGAIGCAVLLLTACACAFIFNIVKNRTPQAEPTDIISMAPPPILPLTSTLEPEALEAGALTEGQWSSWSAANSIETLFLRGEEIYAGGAGGITVWNKRDKSFEQLTTQNGLPGPMITKILGNDEDDSIWVGSDEGIGYYNGESWNYYGYDQGLDSSFVSDIALVNETVWAGTHYGGYDGSGLHRFNGESWELLPGFPSTYEDDPTQVNPNTLSYNVNVILGDEDNNLWVATTAGVGFYDYQTWRIYDTSSGLANENISSMLFDSVGRLWLGAYDATIYRLNGTSFDPVVNLAEYGIYTLEGILEDTNGLLWFAGSGGIVSLNPENDGLTIYTPERTNFPAYEISSIVEDESGILFLGARGEGVLSFYDNEFKVWTVPNTPSHLGYSRIIPAPDGSLWFIEEYGNNLVDVLNPSKLQWTARAAGEICCPIPLAWNSAGELVSGGYNGLWITSPNQQITNYGTDQGIPSDYVSAVAFTPDGLTWVGTDLGLAAFDGQQVTNIVTSADGLPGDYIYALKTTSDGSLWVGSNLGVSQRTPSGEWIQYRAGQTFSEAMEAATDIVEASDGSLWITTSGDGIYHFSGGEWTRYYYQDGTLPVEWYYFTSAAQAQDGSLWFGAYWEGALRYVDGSWNVISGQNGLVHYNVNDIYADPAGAVWFATSGGVSRWTP